MRWWNKFSFRLMALMLVVALVPLLGFGVFSFRSGRAALEREIRRANLAVAVRGVELVEASVETVQRHMRAAVPAIASQSTAFEEETLQILLKMHPEVISLTVLDPGGMERVKLSREAVFTPQDLTRHLDDAGLAATLAGRDYVSPVSMAEPGRPVVTLATPIENLAENEVVGALTAEVSLRGLLSEATALKVGMTGYVFVVDGEGRVIAHPDASLVLAHQNLSDNPEVTNFLAGLTEMEHATIRRYPNREGVEVLGVQAGSDSLGWGVIVEQPVAEALAPIRALAIRLAVSIGVVAAAVGGVGVYLTRRLTRPLRSLSRTADQVAAGDLEVRAAVTTLDELGVLATAFNEMIQRVQNWREELEAQVKVRTQELNRVNEDLQKEVAERAQAQAALARQEAELRATLYSIGDAVIAGDIEGRVVRMNPVAEQLTGWAEDEAIGKPLDEVFHILNEETRQLVESPVARVLREGVVVGLANHTLLISKNGKEIAIADAGAPIQDDEGSIVGVVLIFRDQTEERAVQKALQESEARYRGTLDGMLEGCQFIDFDWRYVYVNDTAEIHGRVPREEKLGRTVLEVYPSIEGTELQAAFQRCLEERIPHRMQNKLVFPDGQTGWFELSIQPIPEGAFLLSMDITDHKRAEEALRESEARFRSLAQAAVDSIITIDAEGCIRFFNRAAERVFGYASDEVIGRNVTLLMPDELKARHNEGLLRYLETRQPVVMGKTVELIGQREDGSRFPLELSLSEVHAGEEKTFISIIRDITARKRTEATWHALNAAAVALQRAVPSEAEIYQAAGEQLTALGLRGAIALLDEATDTFVFEHLFFPAKLLKALERLTGFTGVGFRVPRARVPAFARVVESGKSVYVTNSPAQLVAKLLPEAVSRLAGQVAELLGPMDAILAPLRVEDRVKGLLYVATDWSTEADVPAITAFASQMSAALENARLFKAEQRRAEEAAALLATAQATASLHLDDVLQTIAGQARALFAADGSRIHLIEPDGKILRCVVALHKRAKAALAVDLKLGEGITGRVALKGAPEIVNRALADPDALQIPGTPVEAEALALAPLKTRERVFGVMTIARLGEDRPFTPADLNLLTAFANQAAVAVENARLFEEARRRAQELEALATVSAALRKAADSAGMLPIVLDQVLALLDADGAAVAMRDAFTGETVVELGCGEWGYWTGERLPPGAGVSGQVIASGKQYASNELDIDPLFGQPNPNTSLRAVACVPLKAGAQTLGALWVGRRRDISDSEVNLITAVGEMAANAIHRATLHEQTERRLRRLDALRQIDAAIGSSVDLRVTFDVLLDQVTLQLEVDAADVLLIREGTLALEYAAGRGFRTGAIARSRIQLGEGYAGQAALERRVVVVPNVAAVGDVARAELLAGEGFVVHIAAPLVAKGEIKGVLEVYQRAPFQPDPEWLDYLETLAGQTAIAINDAALFEGLQRTNIELSLAYDATIEGWARALDLRDRETEGHTRRVTEMTERLARALGFPDAQLGHLRRGALLHDIGKIGVPDHILRKPGPLDDAEWEVMRRHPQYAFDMLTPIAYLRPALDIPYCHHEKWDGTGYPRGLRSEQIPMAARIFAVVDVWDALRSNRPYRAAWPEERVQAYLREQAGGHFDPDIATAFLTLTEQ